MTNKIASVLALAVLAMSLAAVPQSATSGVTAAAGEGATAHIGAYLGGEKGGNAGAAIGGFIGAATGAVVGSYLGSSMGPAGTVFWGWRTASFARALGGMAGAA